MIRDNFKIIKDFFHLVKGDKKWIVQLFIASILGHLSSLFLPIAASMIIKCITEQSFTQAFEWSFVLAVIYFVYNMFWYWNYVAYGYNFKYCYTKLQYQIINKVGTYDEEFSRKISRGKIINTTNRDVADLSMFVDTVCEYIVVLIKVVVIACIFLSINIWMGICVMLIFITYMLVMNDNNKKASHHLEGQRKYADKISDIFSQTLSGLREIKTFNMMPKLNQKFEIVKKKYEKQYLLKRKYYTRKHTIIPFIVDYGKVLLYVALIYLASIGRFEVDAVILLISYYENLVTEVTDLMSYSSEIRDQNVAIKRIHNILNYTSSNIIDFGKNENDYIYGLVELKKVNFGYPQKQILKNINMKMKPNTITAIVGHTGSGKSTILNLLLRLYKIDSGTITIDGINIYEYSKKIYSSNVSVVNQKPFIFNMTIYDNLAMVEKSKKKIIEACKRVGIHDFIMTLPKQYRTVLKEDATDLSGGQKQLISIARTLLSGSEILLLDEVTSALDPHTAEHIANLLEDLKQDHTIIMVTHKPNMMKKADYLYVLKDGKIVGEGTHRQLLRDNKYYQQLQNINLNS